MRLVLLLPTLASLLLFTCGGAAPTDDATATSTVDTTATVPQPDAEGFVSIFNGETLDGWEGDPEYWRVEAGGVMVGEVRPDNLVKRNSFIIWRGGQPADFELKVQYRLATPGNSGINYRSEEIDTLPYALRGYQADLDSDHTYSGMNYEERRRTTLASRGEKVVLPTVEGDLTDHIEDNRWMPIQVTESLGDSDELRQSITDDWNDYHVIARGNRLQHYINGVLMSDVTDEDTTNRRFEGLIGVQVHVGPPMKIEYRNWRLKEL